MSSRKLENLCITGPFKARHVGKKQDLTLSPESGSYNGKRRIRGGRHRIRTVMFMAMLSSIQCNPVFKRHYERLKAAEKLPKVALVACMRKLIVILNTMLKK